MQVWNRLFIEQAGAVPPILAALVLVAGVIILLLGWRLSRLVVTFDFAVFGLITGAVLAPGEDLCWLSAGAGAVAFGVLALWLDQYGEMVAGGLTAGLTMALVMVSFNAPVLGTVLAIAAAFACAVAFGMIVAKEATAVTTGIQGGLLAAFGLASCLACNGAVWWGLRDVLISSNFALMAFLLAPIGVGITFQLASIQNEEVVAQ